jgi:hypothetical protein
MASAIPWSRREYTRHVVALCQAPPSLRNLRNMTDIGEKQLDIAAGCAQVGAEWGSAAMPDIVQAEDAVSTTAAG